MKTIKNYELLGFSGLVIQRRVQRTGTVVGLYHGLQSGMESDPELPWVTVCEEHHTLVAHPTQALARTHVAAPDGWCEECAAIVAAKEMQEHVGPRDLKEKS